MTPKMTFGANKNDDQISMMLGETKQVNAAFEYIENSLAVFISNEEANAQMTDFKAKIRAQNKLL